MPPTVEQLQERLDDVLNGTHFKQNLAIFADAIVSHSMPLELSRLSCPNCNFSNPNSRNGIFEGLPIPSETRSRQHKDQEGPIEIISCTVCQMKFSSLELNIALLKQERPIQFDENEFNLAEIPCPGCSKLDRTKLMGVFSIYNDTQVETKYRKTGRKSPLYRCHFCSERFDTATLRMVSLKQQIPGQVFSPFMTQSQSTSASCDCIEDTATENKNGSFRFECKKETEKMYQQKLREDCDREDCDCRDICLTFLHDDPFLKEILCLPQPPCLRHISKEAADYIMAAILMRYNTHSWSHRGSCFEASARTRAINTEFIKVCRYLYPREPIDGTQYSGVKMQLQRTIGSEYLNAYNYFTTMAFRCNCDIQILLQSYGACEIIYYVYKYGFKNQQRIDSAAVLAVNSLRKRITRENQDEKVGDMVTEDTKAKRRINALSIGITNRQEIADTICSSIILYGTLSKFSHDFDNLHLGQYMKILESEPFTAMLEKVTKMDSNGDKNVTFHPSSDFTYYTGRGEELDYINTFLFCSKWRKMKKLKSREGAVALKSSHRNHKTMELCPRELFVIPSVIGPRLPCLPSKEHITPKEKELYAKIVLILFKPFRSVEDLLGGCESWWDAYTTFVSDDKSAQVIRNMCNYIIIRDHAKMTEFDDLAAERLQTNPAMNEVPSDDEHLDGTDDDLIVDDEDKDFDSTVVCKEFPMAMVDKPYDISILNKLDRLQVWNVQVKQLADIDKNDQYKKKQSRIPIFPRHMWRYIRQIDVPVQPTQK